MFSRKRIIWVVCIGLALAGAFIFFVNYSLRDSIQLEDRLDDTICSMKILQDMPELTLCEREEALMLLIATENFSGHYFYDDIQRFVRTGQTRIVKRKDESLVILRNPDGSELRIQFDIEVGGKLWGGRILE